MTYIIVAFATVLLNNVFLSLFSFKVRIIFGYAISLTTLVFVALCEVAWHMFTTQTAYSVNLVAVSLTAIGCTGKYDTKFKKIKKKKEKDVELVLNTFFFFASFYYNSTTIKLLWVR